MEKSAKPSKGFLLIWLVLAGLGFHQLGRYSSTAGAPADAPGHWPKDTALGRDERKPTLVLFAHPKCPCSKASVEELNRLMAHFETKVRVLVVFYRSENATDDWAKTDLWTTASSLPGASVSFDPGGIEAERFGAKTSGQTLFFDPSGNLIFSGGITPARGHRGDSEGRRAVLTFLRTGSTPIRSAPVFGCSLRDSERAIASMDGKP